jgi:hypothetical protein
VLPGTCEQKPLQEPMAPFSSRSDDQVAGSLSLGSSPDVVSAEGVASAEVAATAVPGNARRAQEGEGNGVSFSIPPQPASLASPNSEGVAIGDGAGAARGVSPGATVAEAPARTYASGMGTMADGAMPRDRACGRDSGSLTGGDGDAAAQLLQVSMCLRVNSHALACAHVYALFLRVCTRTQAQARAHTHTHTHTQRAAHSLHGCHH